MFEENISSFGIPHKVISDNMPFESREINNFSKTRNFQVVTSSPHYPRGNSLVERGIGIAKTILKNQQTQVDIELFLLNYRNSPVTGLNYSPSELLQSRILRSKVSISEKKNEIKKFNRKSKETSKMYNRYATISYKSQ